MVSLPQSIDGKLRSRDFFDVQTQEFTIRFPAGKLVFLMPTKPLVNQQHEACQTSCGIPAADAATITGDDPDNWREAAVSQLCILLRLRLTSIPNK